MAYEHSFSSVYDIFTEEVGYKRRAEYICSLLSCRGITGGDMLDLACGTGSMSREFLLRGFELTSVDSSVEMLNIAREKLASFGDRVILLCQDMCSIDLFGTVDCAICTLDSLNHLTEKEDFEAAIAGVSLFLRPGGVFIFDVNTPYKHKNVLSDKTFVYESDDDFLVWQNSVCDSRGQIDIMIDIFTAGEDGKYIRSSEDFSERAYEAEYITEVLKKNGFGSIKIYGDMTTDEAKENDERVYFSAVRE